jgi:hypothetical protein
MPSIRKRKSDHNDGNAFDLTHDPDNGIDCNLFSKLVLLDFWVTGAYTMDCPGVHGYRLHNWKDDERSGLTRSNLHKMCLGKNQHACQLFLEATMAIDVYLQIDGIKGESTDSAHQGWIEVTSAQLGVSQP